MLTSNYAAVNLRAKRDEEVLFGLYVTFNEIADVKVVEHDGEIWVLDSITNITNLPNYEFVSIGPAKRLP